MRHGEHARALKRHHAHHGAQRKERTHHIQQDTHTARFSIRRTLSCLRFRQRSVTCEGRVILSTARCVAPGSSVPCAKSQQLRAITMPEDAGEKTFRIRPRLVQHSVTSMEYILSAGYLLNLHYNNWFHFKATSTACMFKSHLTLPFSSCPDSTGCTVLYTY